MPKTKLHKKIDVTQLKTISQVHQTLGEGFSPSTIVRRIKSGEYKEGVHWYNVAPKSSKKRIIKLNLDEIIKAFT